MTARKRWLIVVLVAVAVALVLLLLETDFLCAVSGCVVGSL